MKPTGSVGLCDVCFEEGGSQDAWGTQLSFVQGNSGASGCQLINGKAAYQPHFQRPPGTLSAEDQHSAPFSHGGYL